MSADNKDESSQTNQDASASGSKGNKEIAEIKAQLQELAENTRATMEAVSTVAQRTKPPEPVVEDENLYEPDALLRKAASMAEGIVDAREQRNQRMTEMSREYPELNTDAKLIQAAAAELGKLPANFRVTADGYETAILKAVAKAGLIPKSKRANVTVDEDVSMSNRGGSSGNRERKQKVSDATLAAAELMGLDINNPETIKNLEKNSNRNYNKYE